MLQTVIKQGSMKADGSLVDLVSPVTYDEFGRTTYQYLPFAANNFNGQTTVNDGNFKLNPFQQQAAFYESNNASSPIFNQGETFFYGKTNFELSALGRPSRTFAPGNSWVGSNRGISTNYSSNTVTDAVIMWNVTDNGNPGEWGTYNSIGTYAEGELYKKVTTDEHDKQVIEFTDKEGLTILKKVQATAAPDLGNGSGHGGWLCTYYIYDNFGDLRCVIQPKGVGLIDGIWSLTSNVLDELCLRYEYDIRRRLIVKKAPGAG